MTNENTEARCSRCGERPARFVPDPFIEEVHNEEVLVWLCEKCYIERRADV